MPKSAREITDLRYAICVGINSYDSSTLLLPLQYAENDARAIHKVLLERGFAQENCRLLLGAEATKQAIQDALEELLLNKPKRNDLVLFYFAGHGIRLPFPGDDDEAVSDVFLTSYDIDRQRIARERGAWLHYPLRFGRFKQDFFELTPSRKVLFLLDSCHSGDFFGAKYREDASIQHFLNQSFGTMSDGRIVLSSCLPHQGAREDEKLGHGLFTYHLLRALDGQASNTVYPNGILTVSSLFDYLASSMPDTQCPVQSGVQHGKFEILHYPQWDKTDQASASLDLGVSDHRMERKLRLRKMLANHRDFLQGRLDSFVGRTQELTEIQQRIEQKMVTGGYVTITGQAGQGKSSIITKLIDLYGAETAVFHFIPFNPGPDHQAGLLRNIMAQLILKYDLPEFYVAGEHRTTFRDFFPRVLEDVTAKEKREIIFIDGLDQLEMDHNGQRDLSFLPDCLPKGIVCVLGTRPNDTLTPLEERLRLHDEYSLPELSPDDFGLILQHHQVSLDHALTDQFYEVMQKNALYLDLVAKELHDRGMLPPQELLPLLANNPNHIFSLTIHRLKQSATEWREVLKPVLGVLLTAREPLSDRQIRHILKIDHDRIHDALMRLGGLLNVSSDHCYSLFHLQFQQYLRQDEQQPQKEYIFAADEEEGWHARLASWCEQGSLTCIWENTKRLDEQERRVYARKHVITHWYYARQSERLFAILDDESYGYAKIREDPSMRNYIQDLDYGRKAAVQKEFSVKEGIANLAHLWCYTLLRCSLKNRADQYPLETFRLLLLLKREKEAIGLAELLTNPSFKVTVLLEIAKHFLSSETDPSESIQHFLYAEAAAHSIDDSSSKAKALSDLATALAQAQRWEQAKPLWLEAEVVARTIEDNSSKAQALSNLARDLIQAQQHDQAEPLWQEAEAVTLSIKNSSSKDKALSKLAIALAQAQQWDQAEVMARSIEEDSLASSKVRVLSELVIVLAQAQQWERAEVMVRSIESSSSKVRGLSKLAAALAQEQQWERAKHLWQEAEVVTRSIEHKLSNAEALSELAAALAQGQQWEQVESLWQEAEAITRSNNADSDVRARALSELAIALAQVQQWVQADAVVRSIKVDSFKARALSELAIALAQAQQRKRAEEVICSIKDNFSRAKALSELAIAFAKMEQWEQAKMLCSKAETVVRTMPYDQGNAEALSELVTVLVQAQRWEQAMVAARSIEDSLSKAEALSELATALAQAQQWEQAEPLWQEAEVAAYAIEDASSKVKMLSKLAINLEKSAKPEQAELLWKKAEAVAQSIKSFSKARTLSKLAITLAQAQRWEWAEAVIHSIENNPSKARPLSKLAIALARAQQWERAEAVAQSIVEDSSSKDNALSKLAIALAQAQQWERAEAVAHSIGKNSLLSKARALSELAIALAQVQRWEQVELLLRDTEPLWKEVEAMPPPFFSLPRFSKAEALSKLVTVLVQAQSWERAEIVAHSIEDSSSKVRVLSELATALAQVQRWEQAELLWREAEAAAHSIEDSSSKISALSELATALAQAQQREKAEPLWQEAEIEACSFKEGSSKVKVLMELAAALAKDGQLERARTVAHSIRNNSIKARALYTYITSCFEGHEYMQVMLDMVQAVWLHIEKREDAFESFSLASHLIILQPEVVCDFCKAFQLVDIYIGSKPEPSTLNEESNNTYSEHISNFDAKDISKSTASNLTFQVYSLGDQSLSNIQGVYELLQEEWEKYREDYFE